MGDIEKQEAFLRFIQRKWREAGWEDTEKPRVWAVRSETIPEEDGPFCVGLTPLSLRREVNERRKLVRRIPKDRGEKIKRWEIEERDIES